MIPMSVEGEKVDVRWPHWFAAVAGEAIKRLVSWWVVSYFPLRR